MRTLVILLTVVFSATVHADKDRAGGNGVNGRPLESWVKDITQFNEFQTIVAPAIEKLKSKSPQLAANLLRVAHLKNWYFLPVRLPEIPSERLGVTFKTDQYALQSQREIWFDDDLYQNLKQPSFRAMILTHELVMGLKLSALYSTNPACSERVRSYACELTNSDYESVRDLSIIILEKQNKYSAQELSKYLNDNNFGQFVPAGSLNHLSTFSVQNVYHLLRSEQSRGSLPNKSREERMFNCDFKFTLSTDLSRLEVLIYNAGSNGIIYNNLPLKVDVESAPQIVVEDASALFRYATPVENLKSGSFRRKLEIFITPERVTRITAYWEKFDYDYRLGKDVWSRTPKGPNENIFEPSSRTCEF